MSGPVPKMTEWQFRRELRNRLGFNMHSEYSNIVVAAVLAAGFEFAPEPVRLPATFAIVERAGGVRLVDTGVNAEMSTEQADEVCRRAMLYPGLRERALALCLRLGATPDSGGYDGYLYNLLAELKKGDPR